MRRTGNVACNRLYNPRNNKPPIPLDVDEIDMAIERFIRQKYERRAFQDGTSHSSIRHNSGSSSGSDDPPPLPPKPEQRLGFGGRAASSTYPMSSHARKEYMSPSLPVDPPNRIARAPSLLKRNKQSQVFGASVGNGGEDMGRKLNRLREMGFTDEAMNSKALRSSNGSLERAVEIIMTWGDGIARQSSSQAQDSLSDRANAVPNGTTPKYHVKDLGSNNPFDSARTQPQQSLTAQGQANGEPAPPPQNPYSIDTQSEPYQASLSQFFPNPNLPQPLFPHATGGLTTHQQGEVLRRQAFTPPVSSIPQRQYLYGPSHPFISNHMNTNPFLAEPSPLVSTQVAEASVHNPYTPVHPSALPAQFPATVHMSPAPLLPVPTGRADKASIMALFNQPHLAPAPPQPVSNPSPSTVAVNDSKSGTSTASIVPTNSRTHTTRSVSSPAGPLAGSRNPFSVREKTGTGKPDGQVAGAASRAEAARHASQESVDLGSSWANGRHSPDAFANLSARFVS